MTAECNLYVIYSALLGGRYFRGSKTVNFSDNIMKIKPVHKNREFLFINVFTTRHCRLYPLGPTQFSFYLSMIRLNGSLLSGASLLLLLSGIY